MILLRARALQSGNAKEKIDLADKFINIIDENF